MKKPISGETEAGNGVRQILTPPPIDLDHLGRQTLGDNGIAREVLDLFLAEIGSAREAIASNTADERCAIAHRLRGAASAIGAFGLAHSAAEIERSPERTDLVPEFLLRIGEIEAFISNFDA